MRIVTLGDVLLDVVVLLSEPLAAGGDVRASNRTGAGGQAANVVAWAAELGADARCIAKRGNDPAGELVARELGARGVEVVGPVGAGDTGVVVSIVDAGDRSLASDRGVAPTFAPEELDAAVGTLATLLHLSGYALLREPIAATALQAARLARERGARVSGRRRGVDRDPELRAGRSSASFSTSSHPTSSSPPRPSGSCLVART